MEVVPFDTEHKRYIHNWLLERGLATRVIEDLPALGYITLDRGRPIAAGFIRLMEGGFGMMDSLITDPSAPGEIRSKAIDLVVTKLLKQAKSAGVKHIFAFSRDNNTLERSIKHGFKKLPETVIGVDLSSLTIKEFS